MDTEASFERLALIPQLLQALNEEGYTEPSPIQRDAIPPALEGRDLLATAQTGTGKTAAFALPILQHLNDKKVQGRGLRTLILTPTRELALQIEENLVAYGRHLPIKSAVVVGGVSAHPQIQKLRRKPEILVATPGRLLDLMSQGEVRLDSIEIVVLDEADRMLDMGFIRDVRKIVDKLPANRQTLLFSATLPQEITKLATDLLRDPVRVAVAPAATVADNIEQQVLFVEKANKRALLAEILKEHGVQRAIVFTRTKHRANRVARDLVKAGISADAIHSNKSQGARQRALGDFDAGKVRVLVATDIVSRGIDVDDITHVINFEIPNEPEAYVHRIGRTARAGADGVAMSFCEEEELAYIQAIERLTGIELTTADDHRYHSDRIATLHTDAVNVPPRQASGGNGRSNGNNGSSRNNGSRNGSSRGGARGGGSNDGASGKANGRRRNGPATRSSNGQGNGDTTGTQANGSSREGSRGPARRSPQGGRGKTDNTRQQNRSSSSDAGQRAPQRAASTPADKPAKPQFGRGRRSAA